MKTKFIKYLFLIAVLGFSSCETLDLDQTENPSGVNADLLDPTYTFNYVQLQLPDFVNSANAFTQEVTRQMAMTGGNTYDNAFAPVNFNNNWSTGYNILNAIKIMEPKALQNGQYYALGASKVIRCYVLMSLVDMYGDIPYSEALMGNANLTPKFDSSAEVYKQIIVELNDAITMLGAVNSTPVNDLYYGGAPGWVTLANTLKLKMYNNARLAGSDLGVNIGDEINAILSQNNIIDTPAEDFAFKYGNSRSTPNTRHPLYNDQYELGGGAYIANYYMWASSIEKQDEDLGLIVDPRTNFYFFRQDTDPSNEDSFTLPGRTRPEHYNDTQYASFYNPTIRTPYTVSNWIGQAAVPSGGFWGRDHGDNSGIPPDASKRTVGGVYPIGGAYGAGEDVQTSGTKGALGAGIMPILMSSFVHFIKAEAMLTVPGVAGTAKDEFIAGISSSIDRVLVPVNNYPIINKDNEPYTYAAEGTYAPGTLVINQGTGALNTTEVENYSTFGKIAIRDKKDYIDFLAAKYDEVASDSDRLELIIKEYYLAAWGNGLETYNNYRRTGFPSNLQPTIEPASGAFYYTAYYPGNSVNNNPNSPANLRTRKVFWDKANLNLH